MIFDANSPLAHHQNACLKTDTRRKAKNMKNDVFPPRQSDDDDDDDNNNNVCAWRQWHMRRADRRMLHARCDINDGDASTFDMLRFWYRWFDYFIHLLVVVVMVVVERSAAFSADIHKNIWCSFKWCNQRNDYFVLRQFCNFAAAMYVFHHPSYIFVGLRVRRSAAQSTVFPFESLRHVCPAVGCPPSVNPTKSQ